jgi:hypothetical protein
VIPGVCTAAVLSGQVSLVDITDWVSRGCPQEVLAAVGCRRSSCGRYIPPHPDTIGRVFHALAAQDLADKLGGYLRERAGFGPVTFPIAAPVLQPAIAVDGKAVRGAIGPDGGDPVPAGRRHT